MDADGRRCFFCGVECLQDGVLHPLLLFFFERWEMILGEAFVVRSAIAARTLRTAFRTVEKRLTTEDTEKTTFA